MDKLKFTRKELYDLVWSKPLSTIANDYQITDSGLRKICKKMNIPLPYMGYWQKLQYGKSVKRVDLPEVFDGKDEITLRALDEVQNQVVFKKNKKVAEIEANLKHILKAPKRLYNPDKLIFKAKESLNKNRPYSLDKGLISTHNFGYINIKVATKNVDRALRIADSFIKLLKARGHEVLAKNNSCFAIILGEEIEFCIQEKLKVIETPYKDVWNSREYFPTGILTFRIWQKFRFRQKIWSDGKQLIEDQFAKILAGFEILAEKEIEERFEREKYWQEQREKERIKRELRDRQEKELLDFKKLLNMSSRWHKTKILRDYLIEVEKRPVNDELLTERKNWINKARLKIDLFDPLISNEKILLSEEEKQDFQILLDFIGE